MSHVGEDANRVLAISAVSGADALWAGRAGHLVTQHDRWRVDTISYFVLALTPSISGFASGLMEELFCGRQLPPKYRNGF
jgi:hypothetical protein